MDPFFDFVPLSSSYTKRQKHKGALVKPVKLILLICLDLVLLGIFILFLLSFAKQLT